MPKVQISHDGLVRESLLRECVETKETCSWCGSKRRTGKKLFQYSVEKDDGSSPNPIKGLFCSVSCMKTMNHH